MTERSIFIEALEKDTPSGRSAYLDEACGGDAALRQRVEALLGSHQEAGSFLGKPVPQRLAEKPATSEEGTPEGPHDGDRQSLTACPLATVEEPRLTARPGAVIGPYKLLQVIGEGGMGTVFMAEQSQPVQRKVALKIIKPGMDTRQVIARFEAERQALALMDHPNIAKVLDAGATETGLPYFVMELVKGVPITKYCDDNHLSPRERLELFVPVCQGIQHAHQKGIIHRDVKPSNVLVARYDGKPVPKVIDFGVAKATEQTLTVRTSFTGHGTLVGTLEYMSPEQAEMSALGVDTRSDVYSLGVLLYELLTGSTPIGNKRIKEAGYPEILRMIKEEEPQKPSTRLSDSGEALATISAQRHMKPARLTKLVRGELDWIVMKCLDKDRSRRYETASGFALDVQRYLQDEPVQACPPSMTYRLAKFVRRHTSALVITALTLLILVLLGSGIGWAVRDQAARQAETDHEVDQALQEAALQQRRGDWAKAKAEMQRAERLATGGSRAIRQRVSTMRADLRMVERLEEIRLDKAPLGLFRIETFPRSPDYAGYYAEAFKDHGIDLAALDAPTAAERIRLSAIRDQLAAALDDWLWAQNCLVRWYMPKPPANYLTPERRKNNEKAHKAATEGYDQLRAVADLAVPNAWCCQIRDPLLQNNRQALEEFAGRANVADLPPSSAMLLVRLLDRVGAKQKALDVLFVVQQRAPDDFLVNFELAVLLNNGRSPRKEEAIGFLRAAVALRPHRSILYRNLGEFLQQVQRPGEAIVAYRKVIELEPGEGTIFHLLAGALLENGTWGEAAKVYSQLIERDDTSAHLRHSRGISYARLARWQDAVADEARVIERDPANHNAHFVLAASLLLGGDTEGHRQACDTALKRFAEDKNQGKMCFAVRACGLAPGSTPDPTVLVQLMKRYVAVARNASTLHALGLAHYRARQFEEGIKRLEESRRVDPSWDKRTCVNGFVLSLAHHRLGHAGEARQWLDRTVECLEAGPPENGASRAAPAHIVDWLSSLILRREAEAEIASPTVKPAPTK